MKLNTLTRDRYSSMKKFTEKVFAYVKKHRAAGMEISDAKVNGVLFRGNDQELYAIQLDKWTSDETGKKFKPADIANELILLERDIEKRQGSTTHALLAARALLARHGFSVNTGAQPGVAPAAAPAPQPNPTPGPRGTYNGTCHNCGKIAGNGHTGENCLKKRRDLQKQIDAIDAATPDHLKNSNHPSRANRDSATQPAEAGQRRQTTRLTAAAPAPAPPTADRSPTPGPQRPPALPAPVSCNVAEYFENNTVPSNRFWGLPDSSYDSS